MMVRAARQCANDKSVVAVCVHLGLPCGAQVVHRLV